MHQRTGFTCTLLILLTVFALLLPPPPASAATVRVKAGDSTSDIGGCGSKSNPCNTIQEGVNNAAPGDKVQVGKGTYRHPGVVINKDGLILKGSGSNTILHGQPACMDTTLAEVYDGNDCREFDGTDQATCESYWHTGGAGPTSCWWNGADCRGCGPGNEATPCVNTCADTLCDDLSRNFAESGSDNCEGLDPGDCADTWIAGGAGPTSCFWNDTDSECQGCGPRNFGLGLCTNTCGDYSNMRDTVTVFSDMVTIQNLTIVESRSDGIQVEDSASGTLIKKVSVRGASSDCIDVDGPMTTITNSQLHGCGGEDDSDECIDVNADNTIIKGNSISQCSEDGIEVDGSMSTISGNTVRVTDDDAIDVAGMYTTISGNNVQHIDDDGIEFRGRFANIRGNKIVNTDDDAIDVEGTAFSITNNTMTDVDDGVEAECRQMTCDDTTRTEFLGGPNTEACRVYDGNEAACEAAWAMSNNSFNGFGPVSCYWDGSDCRGCAGNNWTNGNCVNTCDTCDDPSRTELVGGGEYQNSSCRVYDGNQAACEMAWAYGGDGPASCYWDGSDCRGCRYDGARDNCLNTCDAVDCEDSLVTGNRVTGTSDDECYRLDSGGGGLTVQNNKGSDCMDEGMDIRGIGMMVIGNNISNSGEDHSDPGFEIEGRDHMLQGNTASKNHGDGFEVEANSQGISLTNNTATQNIHDGFDVRSGADDTSLTGNKATKNDGNGFEVSLDATDTIVQGNNASGNLTSDFCDEGTNTTITGNNFGLVRASCGRDNTD